MNLLKPIPQILYHGTTKEYVENSLARYGKHMNCEDGVFFDIWVSNKTRETVIWAGIYGRAHEATPVLLVIDSSKVTSPMRPRGSSFKCDYLDANSFQMVELKWEKEDGLFTESGSEDIAAIVRQIEQGKSK